MILSALDSGDRLNIYLRTHDSSYITSIRKSTDRNRFYKISDARVDKEYFYTVSNPAILHLSLSIAIYVAGTY